MKSIVFFTVAALALIGGVPAQAKGCLKGAAAGAVAGHVAGHHAVAGAIGGCVVGRHLANRKAADQKQKQDPLRQTPVVGTKS